jgi:hypothetical protein
MQRYTYIACLFFILWRCQRFWQFGVNGGISCKWWFKNDLKLSSCLIDVPVCHVPEEDCENLKIAGMLGEIRTRNCYSQYRSETVPLHRPARLVWHISGFEPRCLRLALCSSAHGLLTMALSCHRPDIMIPETCILLEGHEWRHHLCLDPGIGKVDLL